MHLLLSVELETTRGVLPEKNGWGCAARFPKTLALFMTKICDIPYPIYDLTFKSKSVQTTVKLQAVSHRIVLIVTDHEGSRNSFCLSLKHHVTYYWKVILSSRKIKEGKKNMVSFNKNLPAPANS